MAGASSPGLVPCSMSVEYTQHEALLKVQGVVGKDPVFPRQKASAAGIFSARSTVWFVLSGFALLLFAGCLNPFAPEEAGLSEGLWDDQSTVGGLLKNFRTSYSLKDSLRYSDLIADEFVFQYFDEDLSRYEQWYRETELRATGGLMRNVDLLDLRWGPVSSTIDTFSGPDTTVEFTVNFSLTAGNIASVSGFARFKVRSGEDGKFRIVMWRDDY